MKAVKGMFGDCYLFLVICCSYHWPYHDLLILIRRSSTGELQVSSFVHVAGLPVCKCKFSVMVQKSVFDGHIMWNPKDKLEWVCFLDSTLFVGHG